jgi:hypothetical protein
MRSRVTKFLGGGLVAAAITAAVGGAAFAQTPPGGTPPEGVQQRAEEFLNSVASRLGRPADEVRSAVVAAQKDLVARDVQAGRLTQEQADRINQQIDQSGGLGMGLFRGGPGGRHGHRGGMGHHAPMSTDLAAFLGMQPGELATELQAGKTLAQVAQEHGKSRDDLKAHLTVQEQARLNEGVQAGRITQEQANQRLQDLSGRLDQMIDRTGPKGPGRGFGERGRGDGAFAPGRGTLAPTAQSGAANF